MYNVIYVEWLTKKEIIVKVKAANVPRLVAILISDIKPDSIRIEPTS